MDDVLSNYITFRVSGEGEVANDLCAVIHRAFEKAWALKVAHGEEPQ